MMTLRNFFMQNNQWLPAFFPKTLYGEVKTLACGALALLFYGVPVHICDFLRQLLYRGCINGGALAGGLAVGQIFRGLCLAVFLCGLFLILALLFDALPLLLAVLLQATPCQATRY